MSLTAKQNEQVHALKRLFEGTATDDDFEILCDLSCDLADAIMDHFEDEDTDLKD